MPPFLERIIAGTAILLAPAIAIFGCYLAIRSGDFHWLNRAGALIVCAETAIVFVEFSRRNRILEIERQLGHQNPYLLQEAFRSERGLIFSAIFLIIFGEFLHGFGDLLIEHFYKPH